jgi:hypothetical protein
MTVMRLDGGVCLHSPVEIDAATRSAIQRLGDVRAIIAPSTLHHLFVASAQRAFPAARSYAVEGLAKKRKDLHFDEVLGAQAPAFWSGQMDQVVIGNRVMREVDFFTRRAGRWWRSISSKTFAPRRPARTRRFAFRCASLVCGDGRARRRSFGCSPAIEKPPVWRSNGCSPGTSTGP